MGSRLRLSTDEKLNDMILDPARLRDPGVSRLILAIEEQKTFGGAAQALGVSQPSVSQQVKRLERHLGRPLFRRARNGVELTAGGEAVLIYVRAIESLTESLRNQLESQDNVEELTIGMAEDFCRTALATILWLFVAEHPNIRVRVISGTYDVLVEGIEKKTIDFAIMRRYGEFADVRLLWRDNLAWIGRQNMTLSIEEPIPLVLPLPPNPGRDMPIELLKASGRTCFIRFESIGLAGIEAAVQAGLGICAGPRSMWLAGAAPLNEGHGLPDLPDVEFNLVTVRPPKRDFSKAFLQILIAASKDGFMAQEAKGLPATVVS